MRERELDLQQRGVWLEGGIGGAPGATETALAELQGPGFFLENQRERQYANYPPLSPPVKVGQHLLDAQSPLLQH